MQEILQSTSRSTDQVTIEPNGQWSQSTDAAPNKNPPDGDDDSDDLIEITDQRVSTIKNEAMDTPLSMARTPPLSSREASTTGSAAAAPRSANKRTADVIDLTLSDDDEPPRPGKRVAYNTPPDPVRNGYRPPNLTNTRPLNGVAPFRLSQGPRLPGTSHPISPHRSLQLPRPQQNGYPGPQATFPGYGNNPG